MRQVTVTRGAPPTPQTIALQRFLYPYVQLAWKELKICPAETDMREEYSKRMV